jgi:hypothetical protein
MTSPSMGDIVDSSVSYAEEDAMKGTSEASANAFDAERDTPKNVGAIGCAQLFERSSHTDRSHWP